MKAGDELIEISSFGIVDCVLQRSYNSLQMDVSDERFFVLWELSNIIRKNLTVLLNQNIEYFFVLVRHESMKSCQCSNMGVTVNKTFLQLFLDLL